MVASRRQSVVRFDTNFVGKKFVRTTLRVESEFRGRN